MIEIIAPGMLSTVQDAGRFGVMKTGFTQSGVMDAHSMKIANILCGNKPDAAVIEMTMLGLTCRFTDNCVFAVSGGDFAPKLNNELISLNRPYQAKSGDTLAFSSAKSGLRCYLAVSGGIKVPVVMGSMSTNIKIGIGGYEGRKLKKGDILETGTSSSVDMNKSVPAETYEKVVHVRAVPGPQDYMFTETDLKLFFTQHYSVTPTFDRMGIRLNGIALKGKDGMDIISDGITFGSVQVSRNGQPIVLMADHQTTGGYAKIATVISTDLPKLAQVKRNDIIKFDSVTIEEAEEIAAEDKKYFEKLIER